MVDTILLILILLLYIAFPLWKLYRPTIEIVVLVRKRKIYLWYNKWSKSEYKGRVYKCLLEYSLPLFQRNKDKRN